MVSGVFSGIRRYGEYGANFLLGTGSDRMGKEIGKAFLARKRAGLTTTQAVKAGFAKGFARSQADLVKSGGFFKNLISNFKETPARMASGWKSGTGFFSKIGKAIKPLGKLMPFAMNVLWFAQSIPDIIARTKDEGILGGIKETGKALANMAVISLAASVGSAAFGVAGMLALPIGASILTGAILGKSYGQKKAEEEAAKQATNGQPNNPFAQDKTQSGEKIDYMAG